jgi:hypothetical protein
MKKEFRLRPLALATSLALAALLPLPFAALAADNHAVINSAAADSGLVNLTLHGQHFTSVKRLTLLLSGAAVPLPILSITDQTIVALLPIGIPPGSYVATLGSGDSGNAEEFFVTLGGTGPAGPTGATGPQGPQGNAGPAGATGAQGIQGPQGATGAQGPQGNVGPTGPSGPTGATGAQGIQGQQGATGPAGPTGATGAAGTAAGFGTDTNTAHASNGGECTLGQILLSAGEAAAGLPANGQILQISENTALFALLGTTYGGDGLTTFALPDLRSVAPNGLTYTICDFGIFPSIR